MHKENSIVLATLKFCAHFKQDMPIAHKSYMISLRCPFNKNFKTDILYTLITKLTGENTIVSILTQNIFHCQNIRPYNYQYNVQTVPAYTPTHCPIQKNFRKTIQSYLDILFYTSFLRTKTK